MGKIFANDATDKGLISKICKQLPAHYPESNTIKKWGEYLIDISPKKTHKWLKSIGTGFLHVKHN